MSTKIENMIADIDAAKNAKDICMDDVPYQLRAGRLMQIEAAKDALPGLTDKLAKATIPRRLIACFATGATRAAVAYLNCEMGITLNVDSLPYEIASEIEPSYGQDRVFRFTQYALMIRGMKEAYINAGITEFKLPDYSETICVDLESTTEHVKSCLLSSGGIVLTLHEFKKAIITEVIDYDLLNPKIPVIVIGATEAEKPVLSQLFSRVFNYDFKADEEITEASINKIFRHL